MDNYYKLPLQIENIFSERPSNFGTCTEKESIDQNLELIFTTYPGEHKFDRSFGCKIWLLDFDRLVSLKKWEETFYDYLSEAIAKYEPRLSQVEINTDISDVNFHNMPFGTISVKKRVIISVTAVINRSQERCRFKYKILLGPITNE